MNHPSEKMDELDWIELRKDMNKIMVVETTKEKFIRKSSENPFVPIGCFATVCALSYGLWSFHKGRSQMSQYMMRARIAAQGFTIVAMLVGIMSTVKK